MIVRTRLRTPMWLYLAVMAGDLTALAVPKVPDLSYEEYGQATQEKLPWRLPNKNKEFARDYIARLHKEAAAGDVKAAATLGACYHFGFATAPNFWKSIEWYEKGAAGGHAGAMNNLGLIYDQGLGVPKDPLRAHEYFLSAAEKGDADGMFNVGWDYASGGAVEQSWEIAAKWFQKAVDKGHLPASNDLGKSYFFGRGVPVDVERAERLFRKAVKTGVPMVQCNLGMTLVVQKKYREALTWLRKSAEAGYAGGQSCLATLHYHGLGTERDVPEALRLARLGAKSGNPLSQVMLAEMLFDEGNKIRQDPDEVYRMARLAAESGSVRGESLLGLCFYYGRGVRPDRLKAKEWLHKAAAKNEASAARTLGTIYELGEPEERDPAESAKWYKVAADAGDSAAQYRLALCYRDGFGVDANLEEATKWLRLATKGPEGKKAKEALAQIETQLARKGELRAESDYQRGVKLAGEGAQHPERYQEAAEYFRKSADAGHVHAIVALSGLYRRGLGVEQDEAKADELIAKVKITSDPVLLNLVAMTYFPNQKSKPPEHALDSLRRAAKQGYVVSQKTLGYALMIGVPEGSDPVEAMTWLLIAARNGDGFSDANVERFRPSLTDAQFEEAEKRAKAFKPVQEKKDSIGDAEIARGR